MRLVMYHPTPGFQSQIIEREARTGGFWSPEYWRILKDLLFGFLLTGYLFEKHLCWTQIELKFYFGTTLALEEENINILSVHN